MEILAFLVAVIALSVFVLARRQRGDDPEGARLGLPNDLRDKNTGMNSLPHGGRPWSGGGSSIGIGGGGGGDGGGGAGGGGGGGGF